VLLMVNSRIPEGVSRLSLVEVGLFCFRVTFVGTPRYRPGGPNSLTTLTLQIGRRAEGHSRTKGTRTWRLSKP
jgi:hypothetical protein